MARRTRRIDFSELKLVRLSPTACLVVCASAAEVFPKECIGTVATSIAYIDGVLHIDAAFPYQLARRTKNSVVSHSSSLFGSMFGGGAWKKIGEFHSHPFQYFETLVALEPSDFDMKSLRPGDIEVIVRVQRSKKSACSWKTSASGSIQVSWGHFRFLIKTFARVKGYDGKFPRYRTVKMRLG